MEIGNGKNDFMLFYSKYLGVVEMTNILWSGQRVQ